MANQIYSTNSKFSRECIFVGLAHQVLSGWFRACHSPPGRCSPECRSSLPSWYWAPRPCLDEQSVGCENPGPRKWRLVSWSQNRPRAKRSRGRLFDRIYAALTKNWICGHEAMRLAGCGDFQDALKSKPTSNSPELHLPCGPRG